MIWLTSRVSCQFFNVRVLNMIDLSVAERYNIYWYDTKGFSLSWVSTNWRSYYWVLVVLRLGSLHLPTMVFYRFSAGNTPGGYRLTYHGAVQSNLQSLSTYVAHKHCRLPIKEALTKRSYTRWNSATEIVNKTREQTSRACVSEACDKGV